MLARMGYTNVKVNFVSYVNPFKFAVTKGRKISSVRITRYHSRAVIKGITSVHYNCMRGAAVGDYFVHELDFMKCILPKNGTKLGKDSPQPKSKREPIKESKLITIVLNNALCENSKKIIAKSDILICADGGANILYNMCQSLAKEKSTSDKSCSLEGKAKGDNTSLYTLYTNEQNGIKDNKSSEHEHQHGRDTISDLFKMRIKKNEDTVKCLTKIVPDLICGDFDSINKHVYKFYKNKSVLFEKCENQENTDLDKCIDTIRGYIMENDKILIVGATGNRFDHTCANISSLYKNVSLCGSIYLIGENNFLFLLKKGSHIIHINPQIFEKGCGILPIGAKCNVKTEGLKYNLNNEYLSFDKLISSSNEVLQNEVKVFNDSPVIWCSQLRAVCKG
ncbi:thiamine pyrophosphokinase [Plasmodium gonderi]|uniref:Thiamine pyrophosphokinase n=1 Tax=Plasmodium gonderi TaxID=77519 RepID=A0A1Y1JCU3_PLAGO|nr:thiamine pyrophosphokinase [Plasmodium gonderi]GAW80306.1 thiamine pyrophosphokinase [Plasmodium gonderi]